METEVTQISCFLKFIAVHTVGSINNSKYSKIKTET